MSDEKNHENVEETKKLEETENVETNKEVKAEDTQENSKTEENVEEIKEKIETTEETKVEEHKQEENKVTEESKKSDTKSSKPKKPLGKRILHFIEGFIIYLIIVAVASAIYFLWEKSNNPEETVAKGEDTSKTDSEEVAWGDTYIKILEEKENFKNLEDVEIAICDIAKDETPELIVYGTKSDGKYSANIYNINEKGEVDTVKFELSEEFNTEYLYDSEDDDYQWYIVTDSADLYEIDLDEDDYTVEASDEVYDEFEVVEITEKAEYDVEKDDATEIMETAKETYTPSKDLKKEYSSSDKPKKETNKVSSDADKAIEAYKEVLKTEDFGEEFDMDLSYYSNSTGYDVFKGDEIFLTDLDGDEIPELFYVGSFENCAYGDGTIQLRYVDGEVEMDFAVETYLLGIFKNKQAEGYFAQISTSPQWDSKGYHIIDLTDNTEFIVELDSGTPLDSIYEYYRFDYTDVGNLGNYLEKEEDDYSSNFRNIDETEYNAYCSQYIGDDSYPAGSASITKGMGEIVTTEFDASSLDETQIDTKMEEALENYETLCKTIAE